MWRNLLTGLSVKGENAELFNLEPEREHILRFQAAETLALPRGVPDELWRSSEPEPANDDRQGSLAV
jgi:hypothetical protein